METGELIRRCHAIVEEAGFKPGQLDVASALDLFDTVRDVLKDKPRVWRESTPWLKEFVLGLRALRDDFEAIVTADPGCLYRPQHAVALQFHQSLARVRYYWGGNRISKTQSGFQDDYWIATGQHPWRPRPPLPASVFIIGSNYKTYAQSPFESKLIKGEGGNPLSPLFPEGGKYFNHYNDRKHILLIACQECVKAKRPKLCKHPKSSISLISNNMGVDILAGAQYAQGHLDEQVGEEFYFEGMERLKTVPNSGMIITETPLYGKAWWTYTKIYSIGSRKDLNYLPGSDVPIISLHTITQYDAGLVSKRDIEISAATYTDAQRRARVMGEFVADNENQVFDTQVMDEMRQQVRMPKFGHLTLRQERDQIRPDEWANKEIRVQDVEFSERSESRLRVWEFPQPHEQYVIGVDVAKGLTNKDASCASVLKVRLEGSYFKTELVAQYHGWINPEAFAIDLFKLGIWYGFAPTVIERNGPGDSLIFQMAQTLHCWWLLRDVQNPTLMRTGVQMLYGVDTNVNSKGMMISLLQYAIKERHLDVWDDETVSELENFIQEPSPSGQTYTFKALGTAHDDRVMSLAVATYAIKTFPQAYNVDMGAEHARIRNGWLPPEKAGKFWEDVRKSINEPDDGEDVFG